LSESPIAGDSGAPGGSVVGAIAPDFELEGSAGRIRLADHERAQNLVLFFMREFG